MLYFCVNRAPQPAHPCICHTSEESPSNSIPHTFLANPHPGTPFLSHSYKNHRGWGSISPFLTLGSLFALFAQRVFHISFAVKWIRTLSQNCRVAWVLSSQFLEVLLEVFHPGAPRSLLLLSVHAMVLSPSLCDNVGPPSHPESRHTCPVRAHEIKRPVRTRKKQ
jgi:hypothetical protein